jgi:hypothetical protein
LLDSFNSSYFDLGPLVRFSGLFRACYSISN